MDIDIARFVVTTLCQTVLVQREMEIGRRYET